MSGGGPDGPFLIGVDIGSGSVRALLADYRARTLHVAHRPTPTRHLGRDRAEYDLDALWRAVVETLAEAARHVPAGALVAGLAVASVGEACVLVDAVGNALAPAIAWFDRRTEALAERGTAALGADRMFSVTGQPPDPTFTLWKLLWHRADDPALFHRAKRALNIADWVAFRLCGEAATDLSLASRTACLDLRAGAWSAALALEAGIDPDLLPTIRPSGTPLGDVRADVLAATGLPGRPVVGVGGHDHVVGGFAAGAGTPGCLLDSMGTAEALFMTVARPPLTPATRDLGFVQGAVGLPGRRQAYVGGGINSSGGTIDWAAGVLGSGVRNTLLAEAAGVPPGSGGACFLPHMASRPPPYPDTAARGAFVGLSAETSRGALFRAVLEGLAFEARRMLHGLAAVPGAGEPGEIRAIGGSTHNALFLRIKASAFGRSLRVIDEPEATALGAAMLGGIAAGLWPTIDAALAATERRERVVDPDLAWAACYDELCEQVYAGLYPALRPVNERLAEVRRDAA